MASTSITTIKARQKFAKAHADGTPVPKIAQIGWGTGGVDENNIPKMPTPEQEKVEGEFLRNNITSYKISDTGLSIEFMGSISFTDTGALDKELTTIGLYDEEGDLIAIKNFAKKTIDTDTKIDIVWTEEF